MTVLQQWQLNILLLKDQNITVLFRQKEVKCHEEDTTFSNSHKDTCVRLAAALSLQCLTRLSKQQNVNKHLVNEQVTKQNISKSMSIVEDYSKRRQYCEWSRTQTLESKIPELKFQFYCCLCILDELFNLSVHHFPYL